jgi:3-oxoacyl-[acyl-carrier protein] reductase
MRRAGRRSFLELKRAIVTGGSGAIGGAVCRTLARQGFHVIVHGNRNMDRAEAVTTAIAADGGSADTIRFDVANEAEAAAALEGVLAAGPIQVIVNNAGIHADGPLAGMSGDTWRRIVDVSLGGFFNVTRPLLLPMLRTRWGRIVNVSSIAAVIGNRGQTNYAAAKAGLHGATKSLALECASRGVTVNVVAPGIIDTPDTNDVFPAEKIKALVPMQRSGTLDEVAAPIGFLCSDQASYITGQVISVSGGFG